MLDQSKLLMNPSPAFYNLPSIELASRLTGASVFDRVFFANSGGEANEGAIKLARDVYKRQINLVRKRATAVPQFSVTTSAGSWDNYRGEVDGSGPLNQSGTLRARGVVAYQDSNTFKKAYEHQRQLFYGTIEADITASTTLSIGGYYNREDNPGADWNGLPTRRDGSFYDFKRSTRLSPDLSLIHI